MGPQGSLRGVGKTALGVAVVRARESLREDRLFDDPYAQAFVDAAPGAFPEEPTSAEDLAPLGPPASLGEVFSFHAVVRTRFFDDYLITATAAGCQQVVLLAAGLDARAFRLSWPDNVRVFELDLPEVLAFKEAVLAGHDAVPNCERTVVPVDLREHWATGLVAAGFDRSAPTTWLAEGLLLYLRADEAAHLLTEVGELSAPDSQLSFEHGTIADTALLTQARGMPTMDQYTSLWKGGLGEDAPGWLSRHGWQPQLHNRAELAASYGRPVPGSPSGGFLTAVRAGR
jgi:methyltransferase (TIGR00027 family)